jgi:hypothetical protein
LHPSRRDIAAPPFPADAEWVGGDAPRLERLTARGPLLIHFFDLAQLNSARAMPYLEAWRERYSEHGLGILGVHSARFPFTASPEAVAAALPRLRIRWPVAVDSRHSIWRDYGCKGWPSLFLWGQGGALRWYHLGEGDYDGTETAITEALAEAGVSLDWPEPVRPVRPSDAPGAGVVRPTDEYFPSGEAGEPWSGGPIEFFYEAGGSHLAAEGAGRVALALDGRELPPVAVEGPGIYELVEHPRHERHRIRLEPDERVRVHSVQFSPAPP